MLSAGHWCNWLVTAHMVTLGAPMMLIMTLRPHYVQTIVTQEGNSPLAPFWAPCVSPGSPLLLSAQPPAQAVAEWPGWVRVKASFLGLRAVDTGAGWDNHNTLEWAESREREGEDCQHLVQAMSAKPRSDEGHDNVCKNFVRSKENRAKSISQSSSL